MQGKMRIHWRIWPKCILSTYRKNTCVSPAIVKWQNKWIDSTSHHHVSFHQPIIWISGSDGKGIVLCIQNEPPFELFNGSFGSGRKCWRKSVFNFRLQENVLPGWRVWYHILLTLYSSHSLYKPRDYKFNCISLFNRLILLRIWSYKTEDDDIADYI